MDDTLGDPYAVFDQLSLDQALDAPLHDGDASTLDFGVQPAEPVSNPADAEDSQARVVPDGASWVDYNAAFEGIGPEGIARFDDALPFAPPIIPPVPQSQIDTSIASIFQDLVSLSVEDTFPQVEGTLSQVEDILSQVGNIFPQVGDIFPQAENTFPQLEEVSFTPAPQSLAFGHSQIPQPVLTAVPSQPIASTSQAIVLATPAAHAQPMLAATPAVPALVSEPTQLPTNKLVTAIKLVQANDRWNSKYQRSGLRSWGVLKRYLKEEMAEEDKRLKGGEKMLVQISWSEALCHLGKGDFCAYYKEQCKAFRESGIEPEPLPGWIKSYTGCRDEISAPILPKPAAISDHAVAQKLLDVGRGRKPSKGKGKAKETQAPRSRPSPYARQ